MNGFGYEELKDDILRQISSANDDNDEKQATILKMALQELNRLYIASLRSVSMVEDADD